MNLITRVCGAAWMWVNSTVDIIVETFGTLWYDLITDIEYESRIKWWSNFFDVSISDNQDKFLSKHIDIIIALNAESLKKVIDSLKENWLIIINQKWIKKLEDSWINLSKYRILTLETEDKYDNTHLLWIYGKTLSIDKEILNKSIKEIFNSKWEETIKSNQNIIDDIYNNYNLSFYYELKISKIWDKKNIIYGNKAIAKWAIDWGLEFFSAYPMTPASSVLTEVIKDWSVNYIQNEDEIAVINSALWASFTGARAMTATSWWGFALMTEALSFWVQAEIPVTVVLSQRAWPSTGTPTYHEAWDLNFALNPTFWDFEHVVLYPSSLEDNYNLSSKALNIADKYQIPVIILTDKQASELHGTYDELKVEKIDRWLILENPSEDYKRYEITESWISPRVKVGTINWDFIASSYEHNEYWATSEDSENKKKMTEKRARKLNDFFIKEWYKWFEIINENAKKMLIVTSFTSYTAKKFIQENKDFWLIIIKFLKPLDQRLKEEILKREEIIFVENNYSWQLENYITKEFSLDCSNVKISNLRKYDLYPFYLEDFNTLKK